MLSVDRIRTESDAVREGMKRKQKDPGLVDRFLALDEEWRTLTQERDEKRHALNELSKERNIDEAKKVKATIKELDAQLASLTTERKDVLGHIPNVPFSDVPHGVDESANKVLREAGKKPTHDVKEYLAFAEAHDLIDMKRASKIAGSRFGYLKNEVALLEFALVQYTFSTLLAEGFVPIIPPVMARPEIMRGMGKGPFIDSDDAFYLEKDNLYLAGSAEHTVGSMHADEVLSVDELPFRYVAFSTCFRRESGSYGKDTRGILRVHQFDKVEMFSFTTPEQSEEEHRYLLSLQEQFMQGLELPYRVVANCTGDMGFTDARQFDIEVWLPSEGAYRETHSASNTTDFQARGVNTKYRTKDGVQYAHMLNATAITNRATIAILENHQNVKGVVIIPKVLRPYMHGIKKIGLK